MKREETPFDLLPWDSDLFGFRVARLKPGAIPGTNLEWAIEELRKAEVRLAYAVVPWTDAEGRAALERHGARLVDRKIRFRKAGLSAQPRPDGIEPWGETACTLELEALALSSGHLSRFKVDPLVPPHVFPDLYLAWIRKSVSGELAQAVFVARRQGELAGVTTVSIEGDRAEIGLVAVASAHQGKGWGRKLMNAAEGWASARGAHALEVVTQGANEGACALYRATGGVVAQEQAIYHVWMECCR